MARETVVRASDVHRAFGQLLKRIYRSDERLIVERDGFPVAVLMSYPEYESLKVEQAAAALERFSRQLGQEIERQGLDEDAVLAEVERAKQEVYQERYGRRP